MYEVYIIKLQKEVIAITNNYWVYENWKTNGHTAKVHNVTCKHCSILDDNQKNSKNGSAWHGPFKTYDEAIIFSKKLGAKVSGCKRCTMGLCDLF